MDAEKNAEIIARIKYLMKEMGLKQVQFADRIGVDTSNLSKYLNAHMPLSESFLNRIVVNLGVSKEWLINGTDLPFGKTPIRIDPTQGNATDSATGNGIQSISKTSTSGLEDTYTITYTNGSTATFVVTRHCARGSPEKSGVENA